MGLYDTIKQRVSASGAFGRPSPGQKVGIDLGEDERFISDTRRELKNPRKDDDSDNFLESRRARAKRYSEKVNRGFDKVNRGVGKVNRGIERFDRGMATFQKQKDDLFKGLQGYDTEGRAPKRSKQDDNFGMGSMGDLGFSSFGSMAGVVVGGGGARKAKKKKGGSGNRIVGYRQAGSGGKKKKSRSRQPKSIFDIDIGL